MNSSVQDKTNQALKLVGDQFAGDLCKDLSPQMKTAAAMSDAFFGAIAKSRKQTDTDKLDKAIVLSRNGRMA